MSPSTSDGRLQATVTETTNPQPLPESVSEAPASRLPASSPPKDERWIADASPYAPTPQRRLVVEAVERADGEIRGREAFALETGVGISTVQRTIAALEEDGLLVGKAETKAGLGNVGIRWTLYYAPEPLYPEVNHRVNHREDQAVSGGEPPAPAKRTTGMPTGIAEGEPPAPLYVGKSSKELYIHDNDSKDEEDSHERAARFIGNLERRHGVRIKPGRNRALIFTSCRDHGVPAVAALHDSVVPWADRPIAALVHGLQNGEHVKVVPAPPARPDCEDADSLITYCSECMDYTTHRLRQAAKEARA